MNKEVLLSKRVKELKYRYWGLHWLLLFIIFSIFSMLAGIDNSLVLPFFFYILFSYFIFFLVSWQSYRRKEIALWYLWAEAIRGFLVTFICLPILLLKFSSNCFMLSITMICLVILFVNIFIREVKNWDKKLEVLIDSQKLVPQKQKFYIMRTIFFSNKIEIPQKKFNYFLIAVMFVPAGGQILYRVGMRFFDGVMYLQILTLMLTLAMGYIWAQNTVYAYNIYKYQKQNNIVLKTEFEDLSELIQKRDKRVGVQRKY